MTPASLTSRRSVLLIGGPDTGKSNFLFRLWLALDCGAGVLQKDGLPDELTHLASGADRLLRGNFADRTSKDFSESVRIPIKTVGAGGGDLVVPDVGGEQVVDIQRNRAWSESWEELISENCGCLLFVRVDSQETVAPLDWHTCHDAFGAPVGGNQSDSDEPRIPTQAVLTDWLQFLRTAFTERVASRYRPRVAVVIAAWDRVPSDSRGGTPSSYLEENYPMLHQFMVSNPEDFEFQTFGVSVVGGDLRDDPPFRERYLKGIPTDQGRVVHTLGNGVAETPDITLPVAWALGLAPKVE